MLIWFWGSGVGRAWLFAGTAFRRTGFGRGVCGRSGAFELTELLVLSNKVTMHPFCQRYHHTCKGQKKPRSGDIMVAPRGVRLFSVEPRSGDILKCHRYAVFIIPSPLGVLP